MTLRFDDSRRTLSLSVHDLAEAGGLTGHLRLDGGAGSGPGRLAAGRQVHTDWQADRAREDTGFQAEVSLSHRLRVGHWAVTIHGRVDGLAEEAGRQVIEEVKSTALGARRLLDTTLADWPRYREQLEAYLWILARANEVLPVGRLVLVSLADGARHVLGVPCELAAIEGWALERLGWITNRRERRLGWLTTRRLRSVPRPFATWRSGQEDITQAVQASLRDGRPLLAEAPTGLGKTAAVLHGALAHALPRDRQVFWATSRNTQHEGVERTLRQVQSRGLELRYVTLQAREKLCLQDTVSCRPEDCPYAESYYDKLRTGALASALARGTLGRRALRAQGRKHTVCPYQLAVDASSEVDVVVGDFNYAFDPDVMLRRHFTDTAGGWVVVADEAHQLVERVRSALSPRLRATDAHAAAASMRETGGSLEPFARLADDVANAVTDAPLQIEGPWRRGEAVVRLSRALWRRLAHRADELAADYAVVAARGLLGPAIGDPWLALVRQLGRLVRTLETAGDETVHVVRRGRDPSSPDVEVGLLCLDPSAFLGPHIARLGGFVAASATLSPSRFYRDLLGLDPDHHATLAVPSPFPPENQRVLVVPRVSTAYHDRQAHAPATAAVMEAIIRATPGNAAVYFSSFAMLRDLVDRWELDREVLIQRPSMSDRARRALLARLSDTDAPVVLAAVLGGIFAEGIDLPPGALSAVLVAGPALPPVGLERDLLREYYEDHYGEGFRYASLVPGMTRVIQAAGRLVRRPEDRGVVALVGRRFRWRDYAAFFPPEWAPLTPDDPGEAVAEFWEAP